MEYSEQIAELLNKITKSNNQEYAKLCYIRSVDITNNTCVVEDTNHINFDISKEDSKYFIYDVKYSPDETKTTYTPSEASFCYVTFFNNTDAFISLSSEVSSLHIKDTGEHGTGATMSVKDGKFTVDINQRISKFTIGRGYDYAKSDIKMSMDYATSWNRSKCGSVILLDCDVNISASHPDGKINISKKSKTPTINEKRKTLYKISDKANEEAFVSLLELDRRIIKIIYNGGNKQTLMREMFDSYYNKNQQLIDDNYKTLFDDLNEYYTNHTRYYSNKILPLQIDVAKTLKELSGYNNEIEKLGKEVYDTYLNLYELTQNASQTDKPLEIFAHDIYGFLLYNQNTVFFMDTYIKMLDQLYDISGVAGNSNVYYGFQKTEPKKPGVESLADILNKGTLQFNGREHVNLDTEYINEEEINIKSYREDDIVISLGGLLNDFKTIVTDLTNNLKTLYNAGLTTPSGAGTFTDLTFLSNMTNRVNELNTLKTNIDKLLI